MTPKQRRTLHSRLEGRFTDLASAKFGTFHRSVRLFFKFFDDEQGLSALSEKLAKVLPAENTVSIHSVNAGDLLNPQDELHAAAIGEAFLRLIAKEDKSPRSLYDQVYFNDNLHTNRLPNQSDNDERALEAVKDRFLRPFRMYVLDALEGGDTNQNEMDAADYDKKTGLLTHDLFENDTETLCREARRDDSPLSLIMIDLDHFKPVNDTLGHPTGDTVLKAISTIILRTIKSRGPAYRWGGDEFSVLLPNHTAIEAASLAERIREAIAAASLPSKDLAVTGSFGVAELDQASTDSLELVEQADHALRTAKLSRDLVRIFGEPLLLAETKERPAPVRKQPAAQGSFDEQAKEVIRRNFFQMGIARCPFDSATLEVDVYRIDEKRTADLEVTCPMCGVNAFLQGPE